MCLRGSAGHLQSGHAALTFSPEPRRETGTTERERINRQELLRRSAAAAGAIYVAPVLTVCAAAEPAACLGKCHDERKCNERGGLACRCIVRAGRKRGKCKICGGPDGSCSGCSEDDRCPPGQACEAAAFCNSSQTCVCFVVAPFGGPGKDCVDFPSDFCADYPPCDKANGTGCPPGACCLDTCCPEGICSPPCSSAAAARVGRRSGRGPTLTR
jgi:hypothetical protein